MASAPPKEVEGGQAPTPAFTAWVPSTADEDPDGAPRWTLARARRALASSPDTNLSFLPAGPPTWPGHPPGRAPAAGPGSRVPRAAARRPGSGNSLPRTPSDAGAATSALAKATLHVTPPGPPPAPRPAHPWPKAGP